METQLKKGVVELCILQVVSESDLYGYEVINKLAEPLNVNENTIYPILRRLTEQEYFETYSKETNFGAPRKYYHITMKGKSYLKEKLESWIELNQAIKKILKLEITKWCDKIIENNLLKISWLSKKRKW